MLKKRLNIEQFNNTIPKPKMIEQVDLQFSHNNPARADLSLVNEQEPSPLVQETKIRKGSTATSNVKLQCCIKACIRKGTRLVSSLRECYELKDGDHSGRVCEGHYRKDLRYFKKNKTGKFSDEDRRRKSCKRKLLEVTQNEDEDQTNLSKKKPTIDYREGAWSQASLNITDILYPPVDNDYTGVSRPKRNIPSVHYEEPEDKNEEEIIEEKESNQASSQEYEENITTEASQQEQVPQGKIEMFNLFCNWVLQSENVPCSLT